jgi:multisubunit Na+/H+ antiporter MnhE subunit
VIRYLDLGISIPLALLSIYMLLTRPSGSVGIQLLLYGFFITMIVSVNAMGLVMALKSDADFLFSQQLVFIVLALIIFIGYGLILRNIRGQKE